MFNKIPVVITTDDWQVIYLNGRKWIEGYKIHRDTWIKFGMNLRDAQVPIEDVVDVFIDNEDVSDEEILWDFPNDIMDLNIEIKAILNKALQEV